jgi:shikimate dehydrogenase
MNAARDDGAGRIVVDGRTRLAGVLGWPVAHSRSPRLHNYWIARHGVNGAYLPLPVAPEHFATAVRALGTLGFAGANVTVPHKLAALAACDEVSEAARRIGAVNTLVFRAEGALFGTNTDAEGFAANLQAVAPGFDASAAPALVLGAGGAARAVVVALLDAGAAEIRLTNRSAARAAALAAEMGDACKAVPWAERSGALAGIGLVVNTTSLGMTGQPPLDIALDDLPAAAVVNDIVYDPLTTPLLRAAAARGNPAVDGLGMLLHQARVGFQAWFGVEPKVDDALRKHVAKDLMDRQE